jgi:hypothetical protein
MYPPIGHTLKKLSKNSAINRLGSAGVTTFYATNYLSPQHYDKDVKPGDFLDDTDEYFSLTIQLDIKTTHPDEYDFSYTQWGVYIRTMPNLLWCVLKYYLLFKHNLFLFQVF